MKRVLVPTFLVLFLATASLAQSPERTSTLARIAKQSATVSGDRGLFTIPSVETLNRGQFSFGAGWSNTDRTPRDLDINAFPLYFSYGLHGRFTVTGVLETRKQVTARTLSQTGFNSAYPFVAHRFQEGIGDTVLSAKYRLQRRRDNVGGIALKGFVKFGTADPAKGLGTGGTDVGADLIFTSLLPLSFILHSNMAYTLTSDSKEPFEVANKDEIRSGFGLAWPQAGMSIGGATLQGIFEYTTVTFVGAGSHNAAALSIQNPSDVTGGLRFLMLNSGISFDAGYRINTNFDSEFPGNDDRRGFTFGITYTRPVETPILNNSFPLIALESDSVDIAAGGSATITATGYDADNDPLTYSWITIGGGQVVGSGETVRFNATGLGPGTYTVRATAMDGRGGVASSDIDITVLP